MTKRPDSNENRRTPARIGSAGTACVDRTLDSDRRSGQTERRSPHAGGVKANSGWLRRRHRHDHSRGGRPPAVQPDCRYVTKHSFGVYSTTSFAESSRRESPGVPQAVLDVLPGAPFTEQRSGRGRIATGTGMHRRSALEFAVVDRPPGGDRRAFRRQYAGRHRNADRPARPPAGEGGAARGRASYVRAGLIVTGGKVTGRLRPFSSTGPTPDQVRGGYSWDASGSLHALASFRDPRLSGEPFVGGSADRAEGAGEEDWASGELCTIGFDARGDVASGGRTSDHDGSQCGCLPWM
jgi:hypothetical protein